MKLLSHILVVLPTVSDAGIVLSTVVPADAYDENPTPTNAYTVDVTYIAASARAIRADGTCDAAALPLPSRLLRRNSNSCGRKTPT